MRRRCSPRREHGSSHPARFTHQAALRFETIPTRLRNASPAGAAELGRRVLGQEEDAGAGAGSRQAGPLLIPRRSPRWVAAAARKRGGKMKTKAPSPTAAPGVAPRRVPGSSFWPLVSKARPRARCQLWLQLVKPK